MRRHRSWWVVRTMVLSAVLAMGGGAWANHVVVANVTATPRDATTAYIQFDLAWDNSWRYDAVNHDAAWVFFKVQKQGDTTWTHVILEGSGTNPSGYSIGTGTGIELVVPADRVGMFVRRSAEGSGTVNVTGVKAVWNIASTGFTTADRVKIQALAVEMVYVAQGSFSLGSGGTENGCFYAPPSATAPYSVASENAITVGSSAGNLNYASGGNMGDGSGPIPAAFPKGYNAFYCMKYELSQGQYADFLNTLTRSQQDTRCTATTLNFYMSSTAGGSAAPQDRNTVRLTSDPGSPSPRGYTTVTPDRACNYIDPTDGAAFADWAGLRPMTELEYEKACRGPATPVANEYAWSSTTISATAGINNDGSGTDTATGGNCNCDGGIAGPLRCGIYATASSTRQQAGAGYWGIMELSGNLWEKCVTVGDAAGRTFTGAVGNGELTALGDADAWPSTAGVGYRGGCWGDTTASGFHRASDRVVAALAPTRFSNNGQRFVRQMP